MFRFYYQSIIKNLRDENFILSTTIKKYEFYNTFKFNKYYYKRHPTSHRMPFIVVILLSITILCLTYLINVLYKYIVALLFYHDLSEEDANDIYKIARERGNL